MQNNFVYQVLLWPSQIGNEIDVSRLSSELGIKRIRPTRQVIDFRRSIRIFAVCRDYNSRYWGRKSLSLLTL